MKKDNLSDFMAIIKRRYSKIYRACSSSKKVNISQLYRNFNKEKAVYDISENEARIDKERIRIIEYQVFFISLLYMYVIINHYKYLNHEYLDTSKEEFYKKIKEKEKCIKDRESELNDSIIKYDKEIDIKDKKIMELEEA